MSWEKSKDLYKIQWQTHGFKKEDLEDGEWDKLEKEFMRLNRMVTTAMVYIDGYERINKEAEQRYGNLNLTLDGLEAYMYGSYVTNALNEILWTHKDEFYSDKLEPFIFMDGWCPAVGARLKDHGNCSMDFLLIPV